MKTRRWFYLLLCILPLLLAFNNPALAEKKEKAAPKVNTVLIPVDENFQSHNIKDLSIPTVTEGQIVTKEVEPNNTSATAMPLGSTDGVLVGNIYPTGDIDFYSITANAGDRLYAATMTQFSASGSVDTTMDVFSTDGTTVLENDLNDGSIGTTSAQVAGTVLTTGGTYFIRVRGTTTDTNQVRPYFLHFKLQSGAPTAEVEPNDSAATAQPLSPTGGWISGTRIASDADFYSLTLNAGDTIYATLDLDPLRDNTQWNGRLGVGIFGSTPSILVIDDASAGSLTNPLSEAIFMTVETSGQYFVYVDSATAATTGDYNLSVAVHPATSVAACTTYTSTDVPKVINDVVANDSVLTIPARARIGDLRASINMTHSFMSDLDVQLISPAGNENSLFTDVGSATANAQINMDVTLDDNAGIPFAFTALTNEVLLPELNYRLNWFAGEDPTGTWTLRVRDDATGDTGTVNSWSLTVCDPTPEPTCGPGTFQTTVYTNDFESNDGGFTHSGTADQWALGLPTTAPITTCNSGTNCWKTNLAGDYIVSSVQNLLSPSIDLTPFSSTVWLKWNQKYQMESASFDHATVDVSLTGGANPTRLFEWLGATMRDTVGTGPAVTIQESSGWGEYVSNISSYAGQSIQVLYHLDSDNTVVLSGLAVDDVSVFACATCPTITLSPATLPNGTTGVAYTQTITASGGTGPYTFAVTAGGLPTGLTMDTAGNITGTPTATGTFNFTVTATDANNCTGSQAYTVNIVSACGSITVNPATLPGGSLATPYSQTVTATGGTAPYTFAVTSGTFPTGLSLDTNTGAITGTPTATGTFNFTITATDSGACTGSTAYSVLIVCASTYSFTGAVNIPDNTAAGVDTTLVVSGFSGTLADLNFTIDGTTCDVAINNPNVGASHTWVGDFIFKLTSPLGTPVTIINRPGPGTLGSRGNNLCQVILDDQSGAASIESIVDTETQGPPTGPPFTGTFTPQSPMTAYNGEDPNGTWTLNISDNATQDTGAIRAWSLVLGGLTCACPAITVAPATLPDGTDGVAYDQTVSATGGTAPYTFSVSAGTLPTGLTLNTSTGQISGTPTATGGFSFTITATDDNGCTGSQAYTVNIAAACPAITITPATLPNGTSGTAYGQTVVGNGGTGPYTFAVTAGALPTGLAMDSGGNITGTPTATGTFNFTVTATDANNCTGSQAYSITIVCAAITLAPATLVDGTTGSAYAATITASGGLAPYTFGVTAGALPTGLTMDSAGNISGTPTASGAFSFTITATDASGCTGSQAYTVNINCPGLTLSPSTLPDGTVGVAYSQTVTASGGTGPYTYSVSTGTLPAGLSLNASTGEVSGTPTTVESQTFTITATDANGCNVGQSYTINIAAACLFCEEFNDAAPPVTWTYNKPGVFTESGGFLHPVKKKKSTAIATPAFAGCQDCSVATSFTSSVAKNKVWVYAWRVDQNTQVELQITKKKVILKQRTNKHVVKKTTVKTATLFGTPHIVTMTYDGTNLVVNIDGTDVIPTFAPVGTLPTGTVGLGTKGDLGNVFDYVHVN